MPTSGVAPTNLAYVIYTSGSQASPRACRFRIGRSQFPSSFGKRPGMSADDVLLAVTTLVVRHRRSQLFLPLMVGAKLLIALRDVALDGERLAGPALLEQLLRYRDASHSVTWRLLLAAGLAVPKAGSACCARRRSAGS